MLVSGLAGIVAVSLTAAYAVLASFRKTPHGKLEPMTALILWLYRRRNPLESIPPPAEERNNLEADVRVVAGLTARVREVRDELVRGTGGSIPVRIYRHGGRRNAPLVIYLHGGGYVVGSLDTVDNLCRILCRKADAVVVSVDYRLAPEHRFPAAVDDSYDALVWAAANAERLGCDPGRITVAGDSAGASLAAVVSILARDRGGPAIVRQVLLYPAADLNNMATDSYRRYASGFMLTKKEMEYYRAAYADGSQWDDPRISPLFARHHAGLPPALIVAAEFDVLHDDALAYAEKLRGAGTPVRLIDAKGMLHGFASCTGWVRRSRKVLGMIADEITT